MIAVLAWSTSVAYVEAAGSSASPPSRAHAERCNPYVPPPSESVDAVIKRSERVVMAQVRGFRPNPLKIWHGENVIYELSIWDTLKGPDAPAKIDLPGVKLKHNFLFDPHLLDVTYRHAEKLATAKTVDEANTERQKFAVVARPGYCEFAPYFEVGLDYLILLSEPYTAVSFEPIVNSEDRWLARVSAATWDAEKRLYGK